jgi:adenylosuccinate synthase
MLTVEDGSLITTPFHMAANRLREILRSQGRHGSCGMGIGETVSHKLYHPEEAIYARDLPLCRGKLRALRQRLVDELARPMVGLMKDTNAYQATGAAREWEMLNDNDFVGEIVQKFASLAQKIDIVEESWLPKQLARKTTVVFEGAQGVLLDQDYGWAPHTTWSNCTFENALQLVHGTHAQVTRIGVLRGYMTRHGAGPFVTEDPIWKPPAGEHNSTGPWQHAFRLGPFDPIAARYALQVAGPVDHLALTCLDHLKGEIRSCTRYTTAQGSVLLSEIHVDRPRRIEPFDADHQRRQEEKAKLLSILKPTYTTLPDVESFLAHVEAEMQTPIKLCSFGPKASDKRPR